ncbi:hypothetical protein AQULUS_19960 [Aquicella lusitana]|uniref:SEC-C motif-containing protein n=2 Tax=Aquicella lusitana TaxID=254246 RepID=A0A370GS95_9COXI|nr:SEC-C motif-containing protein [Aquicella lusitana]VVC74231.1 hypothetical protein AQULUS_19960 [Aquicella lusitana]
MRSRYTAYTQANIDYIQQTMKLPAANLFDAEKVRQWATEIKWIGLKVIASSCDKTKGIVEFVASFSYHDQLQQMHEHSEFRLEEGKWFYVDGKILPSHPTTATVSKIGRNETCPCGSGKKFKKCCGI